jgi:hypothetical protein
MLPSLTLFTLKCLKIVKDGPSLYTVCSWHFASLLSNPTFFFFILYKYLIITIYFNTDAVLTKRKVPIWLGPDMSKCQFDYLNRCWKIRCRFDLIQCTMVMGITILYQGTEQKKIASRAKSQWNCSLVCHW